MFKWISLYSLLMAAVVVITYSIVGGDAHRYRLAHLDDYTVKVLVPGGHGSGVLVTAPNGDTYVLTAGHVAMRVNPESFNTPAGANPAVYTMDGKSHTGKVIWVSSTDDLALIKIYDKLPGTTINCDRAEVGTKIQIVGAPNVKAFQMDWLHTWATVGGYYGNPFTDVDIMLFDGSVYGGNSGGPIFNEDGEVVGIVIGMFGDYGMYGSLIPMGYNVGVPSDTICDHLGW